jgi:hypothetical protein
MTRLELSMGFNPYDHFVARPSRILLWLAKTVEMTGLPASNELASHKESDEHRRLGTETEEVTGSSVGVSDSGPLCPMAIM